MTPRLREAHILVARRAPARLRSRRRRRLRGGRMDVTRAADAACHVSAHAFEQRLDGRSKRAHLPYGATAV